MALSYIDLIILVVMALVVFSGCHKGFVRTLFSLAKFVVTIPLAFLLSDWLTPYVMRDIVTPYALEQLETKLQTVSGSGSVAEAVRSVLPFLPDSAADSLQQQWDLAVAADPAFVQHLFDNTIEPVANIVVQVLVFLAACLVLSIALWLISLLLKPKKDSTLGKADRVFGGVLGFVKAVMLLFVFCTIIQVLSTFLASFESSSLAQALEQRFIIRQINTINPFNDFV